MTLLDDRPTTVPPQDPPAAPPAPSPSRSQGLDVLRGLVVAWLLVLVFTPTSGLRGHAAWYGWGQSDVFFPMFLLVAGAGLAVQTARRVPWGRLVRRCLALIALGLLVNAWLGRGPDLSQLRYTGVLQRIAVVGLAGALVVVALRRRWLPVGVAAVVTALAWGLLLRAASGDCPGGIPSVEGCGTFYDVEVALFGADHVYGAGAQTHDPEGLVSSLGALATFLAGASAALLLLRLRERPALQRAGALLAMAAGWALAWPLAEALLQPMAKRLWTPSFLAAHAALGIALLALAVLAFDSRAHPAVQRARSALAWPVVALGRNALVLWIGVFVMLKALEVTPAGPDGVPLGEHLLAVHGAVGFFLLTAGTAVVVACGMHAARWHVRL